MTDRAAVVIGINYDRFPTDTSAEVQTRSGLNALRYAEADAQGMGTVLQQAGYDVALLTGTAATRRAIIETIRKQRQTVGPDGLLVVHFAGHGDVDADNIAYLLPADADPDELAATAIPLDDLAMRYFGQVGSAVTLIDCCHSGYAVGVRGLADEEARGRARIFLNRTSSSFESVRGRVVLAACAGDQLARELPQFQHGAFTYYALQQWRSNPEEVDVELLFRGIDQGLQSLGLPRPVKGGVQEGRLVLREANPRYLEQRQQLYNTISAFDNENLDMLLFSLGLDYNTLSGENRGAKIRNLIVSADRAGRLADLEKVVRQQIESQARAQEAQAAAERNAQEQAARVAADRLAREQAARDEAARLAREQAARDEAARLAREQAERKGEELRAQQNAQRRVDEEAAHKAQEARLARLFDEGLEAYQQGDWELTRYLLGELVAAQPDYARNGRRAAPLLAHAKRQQMLAFFKNPTVVTIGIGGFAVLLVVILWFQSALQGTHGGVPTPTLPPLATTAPAMNATPATGPQEAIATTAATAGEIEVKLGEWFIEPKQIDVAQGKVTFKVANSGNIRHDLTILKGGQQVARSKLLAKGESTTITVDLDTGSYATLCDVVGHKDAGMEGILIVR